MKTSTWIIFAAIAVAVFIAAAIWYSRSNSKTKVAPAPQNGETVNLAELNGKKYMVDSDGITLYYFPKDAIGESNCEGACLAAWPIFYSENIAVSSPLEKDNFSQITRPDGSLQTAYRGWPLYYYYLDRKPGDLLGEGVGNVWYIVPEPFYTVMLQNQETTGNYLVDANGISLYYFANDARGIGAASPQSVCAGQCLANWPIFYADDIIVPSLLKNSDFSVLNRSDGAKQIVYKGWPLYYYYLDEKSGDVKGDKFNNVWFLIKP